jgi:hypothetical protein
MKNPEPIKRALRIEKRRKFLGADRCFYCPESRISALEQEHPVGIQRDPKFFRAVCRNCHRDLEMRRDVAGLTKNGQHKRESRSGKRRAYMLLLAFDQESIADAIESPYANNSLIAAALRSIATSLRCRAVEFYPTGNFSGKKPRREKRRRR